MFDFLDWLSTPRSTGKGGRERVAPIHRGFFAELTNYLRHERPFGCGTVECFVVLRGPTAGQAMTEAGMRKVFRTHRDRGGAMRVRPHRLRHTYGTDLAAAGMDLLVLRELMGHASPETTTGYVHVSPAGIADTAATSHPPSSKQCSTLPNRPTRPWLESNSPSLHQTQGSSVFVKRRSGCLRQRC